MKPAYLESAREEVEPAASARRLGVRAACLAARMEDRIEAFACAGAENLGHLEDQLAAAGRELLRQAGELGAQKKADATPPRCPRCQRALTRLSAGHDRSFATRFGEVTVHRSRGYCPKCRKWRMLADDRFPQARQWLDFYHAGQHLAAVGRGCFGEDRARLQAWFQPRVRQLQNESAVKVARPLEKILARLPSGATAAAVRTEVSYFHEHQARMDYRSARRRGRRHGYSISQGLAAVRPRLRTGADCCSAFPFLPITGYG